MGNPLAPTWLDQPAHINALDAKVWPRHASRRATGEVEIASVGVSELATQFGTPLYVIDEDDFRARATAAKHALESAAKKIGTSAKVYYASKAFLSTEIVGWINELGLNIDVASGGELAAALAGGIPAERIGLHGNNKSLREIGRAVTAGVGAIVIDSEIEIERIASAAGAQDTIQGVRLRVNTGVHANTHDFLATAREDQKFGIALADVPNLVAKIRSHSHLKFLGFHQHVGSQIFAVEGFVESTKRLLALHAEMLAGGDIPEINLGGGFGVNYKPADDAPNIGYFADAISAVVEEQCAKLGISVPKLAFEPGRYIAGPAGITLYNVGTIKDVKVTDVAAPAVRKYISVDGGMSDNARTALYEAEYHVTLASRSSTAMPELARVVGKHCESGDIVVRNDYLPADIQPNDLLAVAVTGAYCYSLSSNYNFMTRPAVVAVRNGEARLIIRGETEADLFARDLNYQATHANKNEKS
ncbi:diaminopimelate decarboxylase [Rhodoluna sp.]|uniref:diaminopimelate decarboxylase n=1 Tax=Rhodoluna sp. TaxID=1969481 RepID=UPI0025E83CC4|nr:diaminopimelate decarboxylase [Rhodoluna sp.]